MWWTARCGRERGVVVVLTIGAGFVGGRGVVAYVAPTIGAGCGGGRGVVVGPASGCGEGRGGWLGTTAGGAGRSGGRELESDACINASN